MRRRALLLAMSLLLLGGLGLAFVLDLRAQDRLPRVDPRPLALPDPSTTVALARVEEGTLLLHELTEDTVSGVLMEGDPLSVHAAHGLEELQRLRDGGPLVTRDFTELLAPVQTPPPHLGAGNNFADHQDEVGLHDAPELFPKMALPTAWNAEVPYVGRLDYEVELCAVTLAPIPRGAAGAFPLGWLLCNDFTDRWAMVAGLDPSAPLGTTGFPDGKGAPGFLPTGPWLVIAEDPVAFADSVELRLSVNGRLRQESPQSLAVWDHQRIVEGAFERCDWDFRYHGEPVDWPACEELPAGTLVLGGTPAGVVFRPWNLWARWKYLDADAVVVTEGTGLGRLVNRVSRREHEPPIP